MLSLEQWTGGCVAILDQLVQGTKAYDSRGWSRSEKGGRNLIVSHPLVLLRIGKSGGKRKNDLKKANGKAKENGP